MPRLTTPFETLRHRVTLCGAVTWPDGSPAPGVCVQLFTEPAAAAGGANAAVANADADADAAADAPSPARRFECARPDGGYFFLDLPAGAYRAVVRHARTEQGRHRRHAAVGKVAVSKKQQTDAVPGATPGVLNLTLAPLDDAVPIAPPPRAAAARRSIR